MKGDAGGSVIVNASNIGAACRIDSFLLATNRADLPFKLLFMVTDTIKLIISASLSLVPFGASR